MTHFTKALADRAKADAPLYASAIDEQRLSLVANLREGLERQIDHHYSEGIKKHQVILESEFPKLRDAQIFQRFSLNLQVAIESLLKKYYSEEMEREFGVLFDTWETFPMAESPVGDEPPLEDQLLGNLLELAQSHLSRPSLSIETILDPLADTNE